MQYCAAFCILAMESPYVAQTQQRFFHCCLHAWVHGIANLASVCRQQTPLPEDKAYVNVSFSAASSIIGVWVNLT